MTSALKAAEHRHAVKAYNPAKKISDDDFQRIRELLRLSPSSINIQPWHFIIASSEEAKARLAKCAHGNFAYNAPVIQNASHVALFCCLSSIDESHVAKIVAQEAEDGRYRTPESKANRQTMMTNYVNARNAGGLAEAWMLNQVYINLGFLLMGVAEMGIDATPMEGVDRAMLDEEFGLAERGLRSCFLVPMGYLDEVDDYNNSLPKSRLPIADIIEEI